MADQIGKLSIDLEAKIAKFESDLGRAARLLQRDLAQASQRAERAIRQMRTSAERDMERIRNGAQRAAVAVVGFFGVQKAGQLVRDLAKVADGYANVQAKLRLVTTSQAQLGRVSEQVFGIAQRTFSSLDSTATLVSRTTRALVSNGESAEAALSKSLKLTETIQQAFAVSGATTAEAQNAIIQLSQGLAAGALRGEEFNSVAEQGSRITQALAASLGVTIGQLRAMAKEGKLTAEVVQNALLGQADQIAAEFAQLPVTIERAFQQLSNAFTRYVGEADAVSGTSRQIAQAIQDIARNLPTIISLLTTAASVAAAWFAVYRVGIPLINGTTAAVTKATASIVAMNVAQEMGIRVAGTWGSRLFAALGGWPAVVIAAGAAFYYLYDAMEQIEERSRAPIAALADLNQKLMEQVEAQKLVAEGVPTGMVETVSLYRENAEAVARWTVELREVDAQLQQVIRNGGPGYAFLSQAAENYREKIADAQEEMRRFAILTGQTSTDVIADFRRLSGESGEALADLAQKAISTAQLIARAFSLGTKSGAAEQKEFSAETKKTIAALKEQAETYGMAASKLTMYRAAQKAAKAGSKEEREAILAAARALSDKQALDEAAEASQRAISRATKEANAERREEARAVRAAEKEWREYERVINEVKRDHKEHAEAQRRLQETFAQTTREIQNEIALLRLSGGAREQLVIQLEAERLAREGNNGSIEQATEHYKKLLTQLADARKIEEAARAFESIWLRALDSVGDALATALVDGFDAGAESIKDAMKDLARDLIRFWAQQQIIIPLHQRMSGATGNVPGFGQMTNGQYTGSNTAFGSSVFGDSAGQWMGGNTGMAAAGNYAAAAQGIYNVYDISRNGPGGWDGAAQGAMAGASAGTAIMPGIGTIVGAIVGLLAGYFGGGEPTIRVADREVDATANSRLDDRIGVARDRMPEGTATQFANGIAQFDNTIAAMLDSFSDAKDRIEAIRSALRNWSIRVEGDAATVENVLNQRFSAMLRTFDQTVQDYVGTAGKVEDRVQRLADALFLIEAVGGGLVDDFELLGDILGDYRIGTEHLAQTYQRVAQSTAMLEEGIALMGTSLDLGREALIRFATDITTAAGGLDRATELWGAFYNLFSPEQRQALAMQRATAAAQAEFGEIGLSYGDFSGAGGAAAFTTLFEQKLPSLSAEAIVEWLEAAEALGIVIQLQGQYNEALTQSAENASEAYAEFVAGFGAGTGSPFQRALRELRDEMEQNVDTANALARAAGLQAAREEDLIAVRAQSQAEIDAMIMGLTETVVGQIASLYGTSAQQMEQRIAAIDQEVSGLSAMRSEGTFGLVIAMQREAQLAAERAGLVQELEAQRASEEALRRQTEALDLAQNLADLTLARGIGFDALAGELGLDLNRFGADLGLTADGVRELIGTLQAESLTADVFGEGVQAIVDAINGIIAKQPDPDPPENINPPNDPTGGKSLRMETEAMLLEEIKLLRAAVERVERHTGATAGNTEALPAIAAEGRRLAVREVAAESRITNTRKPLRIEP